MAKDRVSSDVMSVVFPLLQGLDTARSLTVAIMARYGEWEQVAKLGLDPVKNYLDAPSHALKFWRDFQATELLRKAPFLPCSTKEEKAKRAVESLTDSEQKNARTNIRLAPWHHGYPASMQPYDAGRVWKFIHAVQKEVRRVLGPLPSLEDLQRELRFSGGTAVGFEKLGRPPTVGDKLSYISVTSEALPIFLAAIPAAWDRVICQNAVQIQIVDFERFATVPKDSWTDRTIGVQPLGNVVCQLAIGAIIRERLRHRAYIDLETGQELHSRLAYEASLSGDYATIDLRNASNSLAYGAVKLALGLCPEWFDLLSALRVEYRKMDNAVDALQMFGAMGNGYTFELETLIFYAICKAAGAANPKVYGDDIIVETGVARDVIALLNFFGFEVNPRKTFTKGVFRESCGGNYFAGVEIKPFRFTEPDYAEPHQWIAVANGLWRAAGCYRRPSHVRAWLRALGHLPTAVRRCGGPLRYGDLVVHGQRWQTTNRGARTYIRVWKPVQHHWPLKRFGSDVLQLALVLADAVTYQGVAYRRNVTGHRFGQLWYSTATSTWLPDDRCTGRPRACWATWSFCGPHLPGANQLTG